MIEKILQSQPKEIQSLALQKALEEELKESLFALVHYLGYKDVNEETHKDIIHALEADTTRKIIVVPRGSFKSTLCSIVYPIWKLLKNPELRILIDSELFRNSVQYLRVIKEHIKSPKFIRVFGDLEGDVWREDSIILNSRKGKYKEPSITCGGVETTKVGMHYDLIIGDDYNSTENSDTPEKAQKVVDHYRLNLNILEPGGEYVLVGTRYAQNDLIGWVLNNMLNQKKLSEGTLEIING